MLCRNGWGELVMRGIMAVIILGIMVVSGIATVMLLLYLLGLLG